MNDARSGRLGIMAKASAQDQSPASLLDEFSHTQAEILDAPRAWAALSLRVQDDQWLEAL